MPQGRAISKRKPASTRKVYAVFTELRNQREVVAGALAPTALLHNTSNVVKLVFSEPGIADLSRLSVFAFEDDDDITNQTLQDVVRILRISAIYVRSSEEKVRGNLVVGTELAVPGGVFSPLRKYSPIELGPVAVGVGDSVQIQAKVEVDDGLGQTFVGKLGFAVPFQPDSLLDQPPVLVDDPEGWSYVASSPVAIAAGDHARITVFFDTDGILDLTNLQICATADPTANFPQNSIAACQVGFLHLPCFCSVTRSTSMLGKDQSRAVPAAMFSHVGRPRAWANLGQFRVRNRQGILVEIGVPNAKTATPDVTVTVGAPFYPVGQRVRLTPARGPEPAKQRPLLQPSGAADKPVDSSAGPADTASGDDAVADPTSAGSSAG